MKREKLFRDLEKAMSRDSLINISMIVRDGESSESKRDSGLIVGHAYTVMKSYEVDSFIDRILRDYCLFLVFYDFIFYLQVSQ